VRLGGGAVDVPCVLLLVLFYVLPAYRLASGTLLFLLLSVRLGRTPPVLRQRDEPDDCDTQSDSGCDEEEEQ
jgi:hypothetical protein